MKRDLAVALSLANLSFLRVWSELLTYRRADTYYMKYPPAPAEYYAAMANVLLAAAGMWLAATVVRRRFGPAAFACLEAAFLLSLAAPLNAMRGVLAQHFPYFKSPLFDLIGTRGVAALGLGVAAAAAAVILFRRRPAARAAATVLAVFVPLAPAMFAQAIWKAAHYNGAAFSPAALAPLLPISKTAPRVIWVICDEWDYRLAYVDRDRSLALPHLDRWRAATLFATHAHPPGPETPISMPGYLTGRRVRSVRPLGPAELRLQFRDSPQPQLFGRGPTVFGQARELGFNTAVIGWFHPYCRVLHADLTYCDWWEMAMQHNSLGRTFWRALPNQARSLFETTMFSPFGQSLPVKQQIGTYQAILADGKKVAGDRRFGLVLIHLPVPHAPHAYNRRTGRFDLANAPIRGYLDSLVLLDRTLGELRQSMESAGTWDATTVLIGSDHPYREAGQLDGKSDERIPFLLKMAGQREGLAYDAPFNAILTHDLLLAVLRGEIGDAAAAACWLDAHRSLAPLD